jgi:RNA polymerase-binding transcription factor DksA
MENEIDVNYFKGKLEQELAAVEEELNDVGRKNPTNKLDWEAEPADMNVDSADPNEVADNIEEYEENTAVLKDLEVKFNDIKDALAKIEKGTYGICEISGEPIEKERLEANPAARTCMKHIES